MQSMLQTNTTDSAIDLILIGGLMIIIMYLMKWVARKVRAKPQ